MYRWGPVTPEEADLLQGRIDSEYPELYKAIINLSDGDFDRLCASMKGMQAYKYSMDRVHLGMETCMVLCLVISLSWSWDGRWVIGVYLSRVLSLIV